MVEQLEFNGSPVGSEPAKEAKTTPPSSGSSFKKLRAWTEMPGRYVVLSSEPDLLDAYGQHLLYDRTTETTVLRGLPLYAIRKNDPRADGKATGGNKLTAGSKDRGCISV